MSDLVILKTESGSSLVTRKMAEQYSGVEGVEIVDTTVVAEPANVKVVAIEIAALEATKTILLAAITTGEWDKELKAFETSLAAAKETGDLKTAGAANRIEQAVDEAFNTVD